MVRSDVRWVCTVCRFDDNDGSASTCGVCEVPKASDAFEYSLTPPTKPAAATAPATPGSSPDDRLRIVVESGKQGKDPTAAHHVDPSRPSPSQAGSKVGEEDEMQRLLSRAGFGEAAPAAAAASGVAPAEAAAGSPAEASSPSPPRHRGDDAERVRWADATPDTPAAPASPASPASPAAALLSEAAAKRLSEATRRMEAAMLKHAKTIGVAGEDLVRSFFQDTPVDVLSALLNVDTAGKRAVVVSLTATDEATGKVLCASGVQDFAPPAPPFSRVVEVDRVGRIVLSAAVPLLASCDEQHLRSLPATVLLRDALGAGGLAGNAGAKLVKLLCRAERDMAGCLGSIKQPRKLIALTEGEQLALPREVAALLQTLPGPFHVVSIVGTMRIGKSFLLSALVRLLTGCQDVTFGVSNQTATFTKGADFCAAPHPDGGTVLFLDVEGADSTDRSRVYDNVLFSTVFLMSNAVLFNCDRIPNDAKQVNSLECSVEIAQSTAQLCESVRAKRMHVVCRNSLHADQDGDSDFRNRLLDSVKKDGSAAKNFFNCFSCVALHLLGCPMNSHAAVARGLEDRRFEEYCPLFAAGLSRLASVVARDLGESAPLAVKGSPIRDGASLAVMLQGLLSSSVEGKAKFASLGSTAEQLQQTGMDAAVNNIIRGVQAEARRRAELLPVDDAAFAAIAEELKAAAINKFNERPFVVVDELKVVPAERGLSRRLEELVGELWEDNEARSYGAVQQQLTKDDQAAAESFNYNPSAPNDDPEKRFVTYIEAVVRKVEAATRGSVASASRDRAINEFKRGAEDRRKMVGESAQRSKEQHAATQALKVSMVGLEEEKTNLMGKQAELLKAKIANEAERLKLKKQIDEDNKVWKDKTDAAMREHEEKCAALRREAAESLERQERLVKEKERELMEKMNKESREHQDKLLKEMQQASAQLKAERDRAAKLESAVQKAESEARSAYARANSSSCFTGDAWAALACGGRKAVCDVQVGDLLATPSGEAARVLFVDVTLLGPRRLMGLNGRAAHITEDHPVPSADGEVLLFADVAGAVASRHWKKARALETGALVGAQGGVEEVTEVRLCEAGPETVVYDIIADKETFYVDGLLVRSDSPPVDDYPLEALALAEAAARVARCPAVCAACSDVRRPKPAVFDAVAAQVEAALRGVAAARGERAVAVPGGDADAAAASTFAGSEAVARLVRQRKDDVFGTIAEGGHSGASLAWCMARLWARTVPLLSVVMRRVSSVRDLEAVVNEVADVSEKAAAAVPAEP